MGFSKFFSNRFIKGASATAAILCNTSSYGANALPKGCKDFFERICCCCINCWRYFCGDSDNEIKRRRWIISQNRAEESNSTWKYTDLSKVESKPIYEMENVEVQENQSAVKTSLASLFGYIGPKNLNEKNKLLFLEKFSDFVKKHKENIKVSENKFRGSVNDLIKFCDISINAGQVNSAKFESFFNDLKFFEIELENSVNLMKDVNNIYKALCQKGIVHKGNGFIQASNFYQ